MSISASRYNVPYTTAFDTTGIVAPDAQLFFYQTGSSTPENTYSDAGLTTPNANPVQANGAGLFPSIFLIPSQLYKVVLEDVNNDEIWTADPVSGGPSSAAPVYSFASTTLLLNAFGAQFTLTDGTMAATAGNAAEGDGGGAEYFYKAADTTSSDNGSTIRVDGQGRRWYALQNFNYDGIQYVGDGSWRSGDIGAQINAAYSALASTGGTIVINPKAGGGRYDFSTPIILSTKGKYPLLRATAPGGGSITEGLCLNYTPVTATVALTLDYADPVGNPPTGAHGLDGITLWNNGITTTGGGGSSATGLLIGTSNGGDWGACHRNVSINGFGIAYSNLNNAAVGQTWINPVFNFNNTVMTIKGATERFLSGTMAGNGKLFLAPSGSSQAELYFEELNTFDNTGDPLFDCTAAGAPAQFELISCHIENSASGPAHYFSGKFNLFMFGGLMEDENATGSSDWMIQPTNDNGSLVIIGTRVLAARAYTGFVDLPNETRGLVAPFMVSGTNLPTAVSGAFAAQVSQLPSTTFGTTPNPWSILAQLQLQAPPQFVSGNTTGAKSALLGTNCPATTETAPYTWIPIVTHDGSTAYIPVWK